MDIFSICRICLIEPNSHLISIYTHMTANQSDLNDFAEKYNQIQICTILDAFTENKYSSNEFPYPDKVCEQCLNDLKTAYEFKRRCEIACEQLIKLNEVSNGLGEQNNEPQSYLDNEKPIFIEQTYGCSVEIIENEPLENVAISKFEKIDNVKDESFETKTSSYQCHDCDRAFTRKTHLQRHMAIHTKVKPHTCQHCQKSFSRNEHLRRHLLTQHKERTETFRCTAEAIENEPLGNVDIPKVKVEYTDGIEVEAAETKTNGYQCNDCDKIFSRKTHLRRHMAIHTGERAFACNKCDNKFHRADQLKNHKISKHTKVKPYTCQHCENSFSRNYHLRRHMLNQHPEECGKLAELSENELLENALKIKTDEPTGEELENMVDVEDGIAKIKTNSYQCDNCDRIFTRKTHLRRHMTIHTDERAFACKSCDKKFRRADHLKIHENYHAQIKPHNCQHCHKSFSRNEHLRRHILSRHTEKNETHACKSCEFVSKTTKELKQHRRQIHNDVLYPCKMCDNKFISKSDLTEHIKTHSNEERPYLCSECGMRFIRNDYLVIHMRRHTGEKPYKCRFCERAFPRATDLTVHERYHTNEKKHACDLCGKGFQRAYNLTVHMRVHTGEKPYQCPHCPRSFSQGNDLKAHIRRHTGERYQCEICQASFIQIYLLNNHKKNTHGIIGPKPNISRLTKFDLIGSHDESSAIQHTETFQQVPETDCTQYNVHGECRQD